jgi:CheY-like chemotaxis protein
MSKILLVDDSRTLLDAYVTFLETFTPHEVRGATSGRAALEIARTWRPDVVVTDVMMPDMNGLELITQLRSQIPPPLPVIVAMSGFPDVEREARHRGAEVFQAKPIDTDELVALVDSLAANRPPSKSGHHAGEARRKEASERARAAVVSTLARRPFFPDVAHLGARLLSRYFGDVDAAILLIGDEHLEAFASSGWPVGTQPSGVLGYALDVVVSGSTLIIPDLAAMPNGSVRTNVPDWRLLAAVPLRSSDGIAIGVLMVAHREAIPFDVQDLSLLEHVAAKLSAVFAGTAPGAGMLEGPGVLIADSWRYALGRELAHLPRGTILVMALASLGVAPMIPVRTREKLAELRRAMEKTIDRLPPRTAVGSLTPDRLAVYSVVEDAASGQRAVLSLVESLEDEPRRACVGMIAASDVAPTDGGAALLELLHWLLASAMARGPGTALSAQVVPTPIARRTAA